MKQLPEKLETYQMSNSSMPVSTPPDNFELMDKSNDIIDYLKGLTEVVEELKSEHCEHSWIKPRGGNPITCMYCNIVKPQPSETKECECHCHDTNLPPGDRRTLCEHCWPEHPVNNRLIPKDNIKGMRFGELIVKTLSQTVGGKDILVHLTNDELEQLLQNYIKEQK